MAGPYPPKNASLGGVPTKNPDIPVSSVFLVLFIGMGAYIMITQKRNAAKGHKFPFTTPMFILCVLRLISMVLRIAWACHPHNLRLGLAANIFVNAGTVILFIINLLFTRMLVGAAHPKIGKSKQYKIFTILAIACVPCALIILITSIIQQFFTLDPSILSIDRTLMLTGSTVFLVVGALPIVIIPLAVLTPPRPFPKQDFGSGSWIGKIAGLSLAVAFGLTVGGFRAGTAWMTPVPVSHPHWFHHKWAFYFFGFTMEFLALLTYMVFDFPHRFHPKPVMPAKKPDLEMRMPPPVLPPLPNIPYDLEKDDMDDKDKDADMDASKPPASPALTTTTMGSPQSSIWGFVPDQQRSPRL